MNSTLHLVLSLLVCIAAALSTGAETRLLRADDPDRLAILDAATQFRTAIADGNAEAARALFAGDEENAHALSAVVDATASAERLRKVLEAKYGRANLPNKVFASVGMRTQVEAINSRVIVVNGDRASLSTAGLLDRGMRLRLIGGKWKVTHLTARPIDVQAYGNLFRAFSTLFQGVEADYTNGNLKSLEEVMDRLYKTDGSNLRERLLELSRADRQTPEDRLPSPAVWQPLAGDALMKLLGDSAAPEDLARLVDSLPGLPCFSATDQVIGLFDDEAGIEITQELKPTPHLVNIALYGRGVNGCAQYQGTLPRGLAFNDTRAAVERKIGRPLLVGGGQQTPISATYPALGLNIDYATPAGHDPSNTIKRIIAFRPDPKANAAQAPMVTKPRITFRLVTSDAAAKNVDVIANPSDPAHPTVTVDRDVLIDESDVESISCTFALKATEANRLAIAFTDEGARKLKAISTQNNGRSLALIFDGQLMVAARINGQLPANVTLELANSPSGYQIVQLAGRLNAAVQTLPDAPTTKP